ncbi:glutathione S-transferase C-terminal domain-containing protein isoform X1 [Danio rerio]|uniref:Glutathione S-transferase C-terminal domain-containing protein n=4 Tax=Danio rerio TaxID=7955 RepID=A0A8M1N6W6_DANRE|nr:glutathione S-transferase C-terminal domain-containing protein [Danio rerio]XP_005160143.1 glutathione S-transferase C-terminal domain-containing protein isoform X1 [Danio rerio]XP_009292440.1 glutathione S-transferase C-terminal domain-containing protein isoform X1 [Danio rerio]XP_021323996.1 glutathione S-transferase C-terminal domain-containing protein isoform X1 [Danio rerio]|eukprot:NP_001019633.1 glutathione S-transferase C-terminal domain-containing protein [Danio rerio]
MKQTDPETHKESLYLEVCGANGAVSLPLHSSIVLFLLSYSECSSFHVCLVTDQADVLQSPSALVPAGLSVSALRRDELPGLVKMCRLPAALESDVGFCRAGLAVVLRHIIQRACQLMPDRRDVASLLGFKNTCLKACAEVSQWTRLCELEIPSAVEKHLQNPEDETNRLPPAIINLEKRLGEPVKVHNDDKIRRQKLQQQKKSDSQVKDAEKEPHPNVELSAALARLSTDAVCPPSSREHSDIRKVKSTDLPELEHVFAEGLYFTLTDVVLLPCIHQYLISLRTHSPSTLSHLPLLLRWYQRTQELSGVLRAAKDCGMVFLTLSAADPCLTQQDAPPQASEEPKPKQEPFIGGPRPTLTKLQENGIDAIYSAYPCPLRTVDWESLPAAVNPSEGKMSDSRALRKQQQLDNLLAMVLNQAQPGHTVVDFCSGGGHVGIVLAYMLPKCQVILVENKEESLIRARERSAQLTLTNIGFIQTNLDYFTGNFNIGVALHACGVATDMVLDRCLQARAGFVISPCCYGFIQNTLKFNFPKSARFAETLSYKEHMILCRFADQTAVSLPPERRSIGKRCMGLVDLDRSWAAEAHGYSVRVMTMIPKGCSPKNNMLVGEPTG